MKPASRSIAATVSVVCSAYLPLRPLDVALIVLVFSVGELAMSRRLCHGNGSASRFAG
jgi:hypothetical protein